MASPMKRSNSYMAPSTTALTTPETTLVHRRSTSDVPSPCPSLLSEVVDERVERFMTLPSPPVASPFFLDDEKPAAAKTRKRLLFDEQDERDVYDSAMARRERSFGTVCDKDGFVSFHDDDMAPKPPKLARTPPIEAVPEDFTDIDTFIEEQSMLVSGGRTGVAEAVNQASMRKCIATKHDQDDVPFPEFLSSKSFVAEQKALMAEIHREQNSKLPAARGANRQEENIKTRLQRQQEPPQPLAVGIPSNDKNCVQVYPGTHVRILDRSHAMAALSHGNATVFECVGCKTKLLASKDSKLLFCSECGTLTPTHLSGDLKSD